MPRKPRQTYCTNWSIARIKIARMKQKYPPGTILGFYDDGGISHIGEVRDWTYCQEQVCALFQNYLGAIPIRRILINE